ncbi:type II toxin-antitoxin system RelE/ParE family toxin [Solidesulfovibrio sp.]
MLIDWTQPASSDLLDIIRYIQTDDPQAATRTAGRILNAVNTLANFPQSGRP